CQPRACCTSRFHSSYRGICTLPGLKKLKAGTAPPLAKFARKAASAAAACPFRFPAAAGESAPLKRTNDGSFGALVRMSSIAPVGIASLKIPNPPRMTVFLAPNGDQANPTFGSYTTDVTEGNAVFKPVLKARFTGAVRFRP